MRLATISVDGDPICVAYLSNGNMLNLSEVARSMQALIEGGKPTLDAARKLVAEAGEGKHQDKVIQREAPLMAPIPRPSKNIFCIGRNYAEHIAEGDRAQNQNVGVTEHPVVFTKPRTAVVPPEGDVLIFPEVSTCIDYEVELTVVIGKPGRNISKADAMDHIFGYTIVNDISARDIQRRHGGQYFKGKGLDGSCPIGPVIVTADEIDDPHTLSIGLTVNGEQRQDGNTKDMIFDIPTLIASVSEGLTLEPGDMIATGTPSGVGYAMDPPQYLRDGDTLECSVEGIGTLRNSVRSV
ncbi:fumarylacetoacetate hydrolase family protein [Amaricoccus tamworthensis]|uniref:fumarylacetoacetate hydrolase family protein n=1 Tax=Amaricoccus tamworthensis TaxID=57002 RepID=UPI003C7AC95C